MKIIPFRLGVKLFLSFLFVILVGTVVLFLTARLATPRAYQRHFFMMEQQLGGGGMMNRMGPAGGMMGGLYREYLASFNESLLAAAALAALAGVGASILLSRGIARPVQGMMSATQRIAEGHFSERVQVS